MFSAGFLYSNAYEIFSENGKMGIKNEQGEVVVPAAFEALGWSDGSFSVIGSITGYRKGNSWGILNLKNIFITQAEYETLIYAGADNLIARKKINAVQTKTGCLNLKGEIKIPFQYDGITINGLRAIVFNLSGSKYQYGLIDLTNKSIIPIRYRSITPLGTLRYAVENESKKIALFGEDGRAVTPFEIDSVSNFIFSNAIIYENLKQGVIDREGEIKIPALYRTIILESENRVSALPMHEWLFIDEKNNISQQITADEIIPVTENSFIIRISDNIGLIDRNFEILIPVKYKRLERLTSNQYLAVRGKKYGIINSEHAVVIPFIYDSLVADADRIRAYQHIEGWSLLTSENSTLTKNYYDWIGPRTGNLYPVINNHHWGLINNKGEEIVHCVYDSLIEIQKDIITVKFRGSYGVINTQENWLVAPQPLPIKIINNNTYSQQEFGNTMFKKFTGEVFYFTNNPLKLHSDYFIEYLNDGTEKTIDYEGHLIARIEPPKVSNVERVFPMSEGFRGIERDGKFGFIDDRGNLRIANRYDDIGEFQEGLAPFKLIGKWGFLNKSDQVIIQPNYDKVSPFRNGLSIVFRNGKCGVIDKKGTTHLKLQYDSIQYLPDKKFRLFANGLSGLADEKGVVMIDPRFEKLILLTNGLAIAGIDGKHGVITNMGMSVIPIIYDSLTYDSIREQFIAQKKAEWKTIELK